MNFWAKSECQDVFLRNIKGDKQDNTFGEEGVIYLKLTIFPPDPCVNLSYIVV